MRNTSQQRFAVRPRSNIVVPCPFLHLNLHANGGTNGTVAYERRLPGESTASTGTWTLDNGAAGDWVTGGIQPQGTSGVLFDDESLDGLFSITSSTQQIVMLMRTERSANPTSDEKFMQWGAPSRAAPGGLVANIASTGNLQCGFYPADTNSSGAIAQKASSATEVFACFVWDVANDLLLAAIDGDLAGGADTAGTFAASFAAGNNPESTSGNYAFSLFSAHNAAGDTASANINGSSANDLTISDMWILRTAGDDFAYLDEVFEEFAYTPHEQRLLSFRNLTAG